MTRATAISVRTTSGDSYLFCEEDGFNAESLTQFLKEQLDEEFPWINDIKIESHGWDKNTLKLSKVFGSIYEELDKIA